MERKHTLGPWGISEGYDGTAVVGTFDTDEHGRPATDVCTVYTNEADAALIAAAPDMREALEDAAYLVGLLLAGDEAVDAADIDATYHSIVAALAKAEGR